MNKENVLKEILSTSIYLLCVIGIAFLIIKFVGQRTEVIGDSMNNTLYNGDNLILNKISYRFHEPERYDIVVFPFRDGSKKNYIKRVIGLPGETIRLSSDGKIYINGEELTDDVYGLEVFEKAGNAASPITLGDDEYFVMGDNRNNSEDSRFDVVGKVKRSEIIGKVWIRIFPFKSFGRVK
ncbi:MAG: signal peptidase I [Lachnospiraceae bacterium]|nr:signal peptidase I [Lachnospiraceae bacterium]